MNEKYEAIRLFFKSCEKSGMKLKKLSVSVLNLWDGIESNLDSLDRLFGNERNLRNTSTTRNRYAVTMLTNFLVWRT